LNEIENKAFEQIYFEYGYCFTGNDNTLSDLFPKQMSILYSEGLVRSTQDYIHFSVNGNLSPYVRWQFAFSNNTIKGYNLMQPRNAEFYTKQAKVSQAEVYGKLGFYSGDGWNIQLSGQLLSYKNKFTDIWVDSIAYEVPETEDSILLESPHFAEEKINISNQDAVFGISLNRKVGLLDFSIFGSYAKFGEKNPFQLGYELTVLPSGNYSLYLTNRILYYCDDISDRVIYKVIAGASLTDKLHFEGTATFGDIQFTNEPNMPIVYNWSEKTSFKGDLVLRYLITEKINLSLRYQITQKRGSYHYLTYDHLNPSVEYTGYYYATYRNEVDEFKFNQHFIIVGLNWVL